ncbi:MAG: hypothetical protein ACXAC5_00170 [Promethearchaeota archaeon]|jgi:hypothetical protein
MSIVLDPSKSFVNFQMMYVEEKDEKHKNSRFHFINSRLEFDEWKKKGYVTSDELEKSNLNPGKSEPGMPEKPPINASKVIQILRTWWSRMTWKEQNQVYARCLRQSADAEGKTRTELDMIAYRDFKLKTCLKKWDLKDDDGQDIPVSEQIIDNLYPEVAQELLNHFELVTEASDDELKN